MDGPLFFDTFCLVGLTEFKPTTRPAVLTVLKNKQKNPTNNNKNLRTQDHTHITHHTHTSYSIHSSHHSDIPAGGLCPPNCMTAWYTPGLSGCGVWWCSVCFLESVCLHVLWHNHSMLCNLVPTCVCSIHDNMFLSPSGTKMCLPQAVDYAMGGIQCWCESASGMCCFGCAALHACILAINVLSTGC